MKVRVAVDGSSFTKKMLAYLAAHDDWLGGQHHNNNPFRAEEAA